MSTSIAVEQSKLSRHSTPDDTCQDNVPEKKSLENRKFTLFRHYLYREIFETIKTVLIIGALLALCNVTGLFDWWIQFVGTMFVDV